MKDYIAGGAGFIDSHMADALMGRGEVTIFDNLSSGRLEYLVQHQDNPGFTFIKGEIGDFDHLSRTMEGHDAVCHFAANQDIAPEYTGDRSRPSGGDDPLLQRAVGDESHRCHGDYFCFRDWYSIDNKSQT